MDPSPDTLLNPATLETGAYLDRLTHEVRTCMQTVLGVAELLSDAGLNAEQQSLMRALRSSAERLLRLGAGIDDLLAREPEEFHASHDAIDLHQLLTETLSLMSGAAAARGIELNSSVDPGLPAVVFTDRPSLEHVFLAILTNAIKFTDSGFVNVTVRSVSPGRLEFLVKDTGRGIPSNRLSAMMNLRGPTDADGLSLRLASNTISRLGGTLWCESKVGKGSTFGFSLAYRVTADRPGNEEPQQPTAPTLGMHVLVADDSEENAFLIKAFLRDRQFTVDTAANGREAVLKIQSSNFDIILMDLEMPVLDGVGAAGEIRDWERRNERPPIPIVALTAHVDADEIAKCLAAGCSSYLPKPITRAKLLETISRHVGHI
jgi:two-component system, sensor histidine kinase